VVFERLLLCWKGLKIVILNETSLCHLCHSSEACPCEGMLPLQRQGQGAGIHDLRRENGFQIEFGMTKVEGWKKKP